MNATDRRRPKAWYVLYNRVMRRQSQIFSTSESVACRAEWQFFMNCEKTSIGPLFRFHMATIVKINICPSGNGLPRSFTRSAINDVQRLKARPIVVSVSHVTCITGVAYYNVPSMQGIFLLESTSDCAHKLLEVQVGRNPLHLHEGAHVQL
jgi:hypothetical protein